MALQKGLHPTDLSSISPDSYRLTVNIQSGNGKEREISSLITSFTVFESIFQQTLIAEFEISDGVSLMEDLNITGNEKISTVVRKQNDKQTPPIDIQNDWYILDIPVYGKPKPDLATYRIRCISPFGLVSKFRRASAKLSGSTTEILKELYRQVGAELEVIDDNPLGAFRYIPPRLTYSDTISNILQKSMTPNGAPYFAYQVFHESKFLLNSYNSMITENSLDSYIQGYFFRAESQTEESFEEKRLRILEISSNLGFSTYKAMRDGSYITRTHKLDWSSKTYETVDFKAHDEIIPLIDGTQSELSWRSDFDVSGVGPDNLYDTYNIYIPLNSLAMVDSDEANYHLLGSYKLATKNSVYSNLEQIEHSIKLHGDSRLSAGKIIDLKLPKTGQVEGVGREDDLLLSGRYLIVSSTHIFNNEGYYTRVKVRRDSVHKR